MLLTFKGINIAYTSNGMGKPVVFLHGFLENSTMWNGLLPNFLSDHQCICIDLLGHGKSANLGYIHTMEEMAHSVKEVLKHLHIEEAVFIGHSMGGYVALAFAALFPNHISGIVLLNSTATADSEERKYNRTRAIDIVKKNHEAYTSMAIANLFAIENRSRFHEHILEIKEEASKTSLQGIIAALEGMKVRKDHNETLRIFCKPKLSIAGKKDPVLPYSQLQNEAKNTNTTLVSYSGGHMTYLEHEEALAVTLQNFISICT